MLRTSQTLLFCILILTLISACSKKEEVEKPAPNKVKKYVPEYTEITPDKLEKWLAGAGKVGDFIRKYALKDEEIRTKDEFMFLAHSSPRGEAILLNLFKDIGLKPGEFWWIQEQLEKAGKYVEFRQQEEMQNRNIDIVLSAGRDERADLEKTLQKVNGPDDRKEIMRRLQIVNEKFGELSALKGSMTPENVRVSPQNVELWIRNRDRIQPAVKGMWKIMDDERVQNERDQRMPGH